MTQKTLMATVTGEHFQPVRLHYQVFDRKGLLRAFKKLRCLDYDATRQRWVWLYEYEAKRLVFQQSYAQIPRKLHPLVIGSFFLRGEDTLLLDLRSCDRARAALPFFDRHLPRTVAKVREFEIVNKLYSAEGNMQLTPDALFDSQTSAPCDPHAELRRAKELTANINDPEERIRVVLEDLESRAKQPLPEIERLPIHYYEDGLQGFVNALQLRQMVALEHWQGNTGHTMFDVMRRIQGAR